MEFGITADINWESGVREVLGLIPPGWRERPARERNHNKTETSPNGEVSVLL